MRSEIEIRGEGKERKKRKEGKNLNKRGKNGR